MKKEDAPKPEAEKPKEEAGDAGASPLPEKVRRALCMRETHLCSKLFSVSRWRLFVRARLCDARLGPPAAPHRGAPS